MDAAAVGTDWFLAAIFISAGLLKLWAPLELARALSAILPARVWAIRVTPRRVVAAIAVFELATGVAVLIPSLSPAARWTALFMTVGFTLFLITARRKAMSCGCFGKASARPTGKIDIARGVGLTIIVGVAISADAFSSRASSAAPSLLSSTVTMLLLLAFFGTLLVSYSNVADRPLGTDAAPHIASQTPAATDPFIGSESRPSAVSRRQLLRYSSMALGGAIAISAVSGGKRGSAAWADSLNGYGLEIDPSIQSSFHVADAVAAQALVSNAQGLLSLPTAASFMTEHGLLRRVGDEIGGYLTLMGQGFSQSWAGVVILLDDSVTKVGRGVVVLSTDLMPNGVGLFVLDDGSQLLFSPDGASTAAILSSPCQPSQCVLNAGNTFVQGLFTGLSCGSCVFGNLFGCAGCAVGVAGSYSNATGTTAACAACHVNCQTANNACKGLSLFIASTPCCTVHGGCTVSFGTGQCSCVGCGSLDCLNFIGSDGTFCGCACCQPCPA